MEQKQKCRNVNASTQKKRQSQIPEYSLGSTGRKLILTFSGAASPTLDEVQFRPDSKHHYEVLRREGVETNQTRASFRWTKFPKVFSWFLLNCLISGGRFVLEGPQKGSDHPSTTLGDGIYSEGNVFHNVFASLGCPDAMKLIFVGDNEDGKLSRCRKLRLNSSQLIPTCVEVWTCSNQKMTPVTEVKEWRKLARQIQSKAGWPDPQETDALSINVHDVLVDGKPVLLAPDLLTPAVSDGDLTGELSRSFGEETGRKLIDLSDRAINAIELGQFHDYVEIGRGMQLVGLEAGTPQLINDGVSLVADGHRLLAGQNEYEQSRLLSLAKEGFKEVLERTPSDHRARRGLACCAQAEFNFGSALTQFDLAVDGVRRHMTTLASGKKMQSRAFGDRHEFLRLIRHRIDVILRIRASSRQSNWNSEKGSQALARLVIDHEELYHSTMKELTARPLWFHFESFAGLTFLADAWFELGSIPKATEYALLALKHRRATIEHSLSKIQLANLGWWVRTCRGARLEQYPLIEAVERLADAVRRDVGADALREIDWILSLKR